MAIFNNNSMIDVTRSCTFPKTEFTGKINNSTGILSVSSFKEGEISSLMILNANTYNPVVVTDKVTTEAGFEESWQTYRILAGVYGSVTNGVLTVDNFWYGNLTPPLGGYKYLIDVSTAAGTRSLTPISVDGTGLGTYTLSLSTTLNLSYRKFIIHYWSTSSQSIPAGTLFTGNKELNYVDSIKLTSTEEEQEYLTDRIAKMATSIRRGIYYPAGTYTVSPSLSGIEVYGNSSKGSNTNRTILKNNYNKNIVANAISFKSITDCITQGIRPAACKKIKNCYIYFPDKTANFVGSISGTQLTITTLNSGFIHVGGEIRWNNNANVATITAFVRGTAGGVGVYTIDTANTVSSTTFNLSIGMNYFSADTLSAGDEYDITDNVFDLPPIYIPLYIVNPTYATIKRNKFLDRSGGIATNYNTHTIRLDAQDASADDIDISYNKLFMPSVTGIFNASNRLATIKNLKIEWNDVYNVSEEAIAIDGFGNNYGLCPCICNGPVTAFSNDANGRLVVSLDRMVYVANSSSSTDFHPVSLREWDITCYVVDDVLTVTTSHPGYYMPKSTLKGAGVPDNTVIVERLTRNGIGNANAQYRLSKSFNLGSAASPVTLKMSDWKKFYFIFSENTGADGTITEIFDYDSTENTLTLSLYRPASQFSNNINNWAGVHAGFFNGSVKHNNVISDGKAGQNINNSYSTGISLYHNVFNFEISHNTVNGYNAGIVLTGGFMLSTYFVLCYGNSVHDNNVYITKENATAIGIITQYTGLPQRGNRVYNNNIIGKDCVLTLIGAEDTVCENNTLNGENCRIERLFPEPSYISKTFT